MNHIVASRVLTTLADDGFLQLHCADDNAASWTTDVATRALTDSSKIAMVQSTAS